MSFSSKIDTSLALLPKGTLTFAELIAITDSDLNLKPTRRRDMVSGLRRVAKALGLPPHDVPCHGRWLQPRLDKISPAALNLSDKGWQNAVSDARAAMAHAGIVERRDNRFTDLRPAWKSLWATALESPHAPTFGGGLCRFVYFLNTNDVAPEDVCAQHVIAYHHALSRDEIRKSPDVATRAAINCWNLAVRSLPSWPKNKLPLERRKKIISLPESDFLVPFLIDVERLISHLSHPDPLAENGRTKALRPATLAQYRRHIFRFASELVHAGMAIDEIDRIAVLLNPETAERGLRHMLTRTENKTTKLISQVANLLRNLGRITGQDDATQKQLTKLAARVATQPQRGMTAKNRNRLRVLQNDKAMLRLLDLPERLFNRPPSGKANDYTKALAREDAVAIAVLLACPVRIKNLAGIHLEQHIQRPGDGRAYLVLVEDDLKNERPLEFELPKDLVCMIDRHLATRCPHMCPPGTPWLFPRRDGTGAMQPSQLSGRIKQRVFKVTGFEVNAHLFRHTAVMNWLDAYPGAYEVARRLLGHSDVSHTINMYSGLEVKSATRAFADLMDTKKGRRK